MRGRLVATATVLVLATACTGSEAEGGNQSSGRPEPWHGGTLRLAATFDITGVQSWDNTAIPEAGLDPQRSYSSVPSELFRCCLLRTLFAYPGVPGAEGGSQVQPDLASSWDVSADGLTWTFQIRDGIRYAPPLEEVEVSSGDFVRALLRTARVSEDGFTYSYYYSVIRGFDEYAAGDAATISGLETPDDRTLVVRLNEAAGDLLDRFAMAATAPVPPDPSDADAAMGVAEGHDDDYGRFLVASGPYMIEGSEQLDLSVTPQMQTPIVGYQPPTIEQNVPVRPGSLVLVRNPSWRPTTDELRPAYPDRIDLRVEPLGDGGYEELNETLAAEVDAGTIDHVVDADPPMAQLESYSSDPDLSGRLWSGTTAWAWGMWLNVAVPPFDDVHVRRAVAFAIDEAEVVRSFRSHGWEKGPASPEPLGHAVPDPLEADLLATYDPYPAELASAKAEMALSRYDRQGEDGVCDAQTCRAIDGVTFRGPIPRAATTLIAERLAEIGIRARFVHMSFPRFVEQVFVEAHRTPLSVWGWGADYPNPSTMITPIFTSEALLGSGSNAMMLGASSEQLERWGYEVDRVPSVDERVDRCISMVGSEQLECWVGLDRYLMEQVAPVVPFMQERSARVVSARVESFSFDQFTGSLAFDQMALVPGSE
ncbi:MAG TPA: ABC transporter substrate-binding protein [Actinomycetota bacterium]|nr:ABC transporter substrate-binding protein [Actinomycetota bacterium]